MIGKEIRLRKIMNPVTKKTLIVPMDHGMSDGPIKGLINMEKTIKEVSKNSNAVLMHKGLVKNAVGNMNSAGLIVHLSAGTMLSPDPLNKVIVTSVSEALSMGADAISVHINVGNIDTSKNLEEIGKISRESNMLGIPLIMMMYPRGDKINNEKDVKFVKIAARIGAELGADIIKTNYTGDKDSFREVVEGCPVPVIIAGGLKGDDFEILSMIKDAMDSGAAGVALGRNSFQHKNPSSFLKAVSLIIHKNYEVKQAINEVGLNERIDNRCKTI